MIFNMISGSSNCSFDFKIVGGTTQPETTSNNIIWVNTDTAITSWIFSPSDPYTKIKEVNLLDGATLKNGFFNTSGVVQEQEASHPELYNENYIPVEYGKEYTYKYTVSVTNEMWLSIVEYTGSYTIKQRLVPVAATSGTSKTGVYTPSNSSVTAVRLSWRTFSDADTTVTFVGDTNYVEDSDGGAVWIKIGEDNKTKFNALKRNGIYICPVAVYQCLSGKLNEKESYFYYGGNWMALNSTAYLFKNGNQYTDITGGWSGVTSGDSSISISWEGYVSGSGVGGKCSTKTNKMVDLTDYNVLSVTLQSVDSVFRVQLLDSSENIVHRFNADKTSGIITSDVSNITGSYYIQLYADGSYLGTSGATGSAHMGSASFNVSEVHLKK